jgi:hypothetical protein
MNRHALYSKLQKEEEDNRNPEIELRTLPSSISWSDSGEELQETCTTFQKQDDAVTTGQEQLQLYRWSNLAIPLNYFLTGLVQGLAYPLINVYPLDLGATEAQQTTLTTLKSLPSCFKIAFGFWSDNIPIYGYRRKPYMFLGWLFSMLSLMPLLLISDLSLDGVDRLAPPNAPSMQLLCSCFFLWACGLWLSDVMGDALIAERAKLETQVDRGNLQAICYVLRGFGFVAMAPVSSMLYNTPRGPGLVIGATSVLPLTLFPFWYMLKERKLVVLDLTTREQCAELWKMVCSRAVWQPMGFIYLYMTLFVSNSAWKQFLESVLGFTPNQLNALLILAGVLAFAGVVTYYLVLRRWSWRTLYLVGIGLNGIFSALQLLLIQGKTFGLDPFWFALGDDALMDFIFGTHYLPMCVMMVNLVPVGVEGASYALFTTTWNVASALSDSLSTMLLGIWDVSKDTLLEGDLSGLTNLTILTTVLQTLPLFFVWLLPHSVEDLDILKSTHSYSSQLGGSIFLSIVTLSVLWAIVVGVMNIFHPGWMGES